MGWGEGMSLKFKKSKALSCFIIYGNKIARYPSLSSQNIGLLAALS